MRGKLNSRPPHAILKEAEKLVDTGVKELLIISQDTSAYGLDLKHAEIGGYRAHIVDLAKELGTLGAWVRLHYVYPYPHVRRLIPFMAEGNILPYLDIPFQHSHPDVLRRMSRPAASSKTLEEIQVWRKDCPELTIRSTFIVGYPGETDSEFQHLLDWLGEAQLDRVGCFQYENVKGAQSNLLPEQIPNEVKEERWKKFMEISQNISKAKLEKKIGKKLDVIVDSIEPDGATCRTMADAPEIDGNLFIDENFQNLSTGDIVQVVIDEASEYDLWGKLIV
jgi:ribosomal protein S12 methylthiotransferase